MRNIGNYDPFGDREIKMNQSKPGWQSQNAALAPLFLAVILTVTYKLGDGYVMGHLIKSNDKLIATLVYLTMGAIVGLIINFLLCQTPIGKLVDPSFQSIHGVSLKAHRGAAISGFFAALSTGIYLWSFRTLDPSIVVPLTSLAVLYIGIVESITRKVAFRRVLPSILLVLSGVAIASIHEGTNWAVTGGTLIVLLLVYNVLNAVGELVSKGGVDQSDAISFGFWRFFWLVIAAVFIAVGTSVATGHFGDYIVALAGSVGAIPFIIGVMVVVFFANGWANRGLALSNATTKNLVMTGQVVISVFATALVGLILPGVFPSAPTTVFEWTLRLVGTALLMWGVLRLRKE